MKTAEQLQKIREEALEACSACDPRKTSNQFFGVGPITDLALDEFDARSSRIRMERWVEENYPKFDDRGNRVGGFTMAELGRSMHRGYPGDKILLDLARAIHDYFEFPAKNKLAVGLGGGHSGFTVAAMHLMNPNIESQRVFVDTPKPESEQASSGGFFRQSWGAQLIEMQTAAQNGDPARIHFAEAEGKIPDSQTLCDLGITLFFGVGHETTGATTYTEVEIQNLLRWVAENPEEHHAVIDATSLLGSMVWSNETVRGMMDSCNLFTPFQKAVGGVSGYFVMSLTPQAISQIESNSLNSAWAIPRQFKITVPANPKKPLSGESSTTGGPIYDPQTDKMQGGIINTFSLQAFVETTFAIESNRERIGSASEMSRRSKNNRSLVNRWLKDNPLFAHGVANPESRGAAVTLLKVNDPDVDDPAIHDRIVQTAKHVIGIEGVTRPNGEHAPGLDAARYINAFPGTPGDFRAWTGGIRDEEEISRFLENLKFAYLKAKATVMEEELAKLGTVFEAKPEKNGPTRKDDPQRAYKVLIADLVGLAPDANGNPDCSEVRAHVEAAGCEFHVGSAKEHADPKKGRIHFYYQPDLAKADELMAEAGGDRYDALIAAATPIPAEANFPSGGVRIGAGTGNMGSSSWGGGNGTGGSAPLMNTPGFNSRATAQAAFKALLAVRPDLDAETMEAAVVKNEFDTGTHLKNHPHTKLEGKKAAVLGFGNIGREMARLAKAFEMDVTVYARPKHREWIESQGYRYAAGMAEAAENADVLSVHLGLGAKNPDTGKFANEGAVSAETLEALNPGSVLINYDRGEVVNAAALETSMANGRVDRVAVDADVFLDENGRPFGPMAPYLGLNARFPGRMSLLPHAAADTEHVSRVNGAKRAADQIINAIRFRKVTNGVGSIPEGYENAGKHAAPNLGKTRAADFLSLSREQTNDLRAISGELAAFWAAFDAAEGDSAVRTDLIKKYSRQTVLAANRFINLSRALELTGAFEEE